MLVFIQKLQSMFIGLFDQRKLGGMVSDYLEELATPSEASAV